MLNKERVEYGYPILGKRHADFVFSRGVYFRETTRMVLFSDANGFAKIKPSRNILNLQYPKLR